MTTLCPFFPGVSLTSFRPRSGKSPASAGDSAQGESGLTYLIWQFYPSGVWRLLASRVLVFLLFISALLFKQLLFLLANSLPYLPADSLLCAHPALWAAGSVRTPLCGQPAQCAPGSARTPLCGHPALSTAGSAGDNANTQPDSGQSTNGTRWPGLKVCGSSLAGLLFGGSRAS